MKNDIIRFCGKNKNLRNEGKYLKIEHKNKHIFLSLFMLCIAILLILLSFLTIIRVWMTDDIRELVFYLKKSLINAVLANRSQTWVNVIA